MMQPHLAQSNEAPSPAPTPLDSPSLRGGRLVLRCPGMERNERKC